MSRPDVKTVAEMFAGLYDVVAPMPWNGLAPTYEARKDGVCVVLAILPVDTESAPEVAALFEARAKALVGLAHPRLLPVTGEGIRYGVPYLELAHVEGKTLDQIVVRGPLERERAVTIARRILRALELLEAVNILHLDLTPSNILVAGVDEVRVMGTGVASILREVRDTDKTGPTGKGSGPSPGRYLAPELLVGDKIDARTDVYSVGALLHYMLTGLPLGKGGGPPAPSDLAAVIDKATKRLREERYPKAAQMRAALEATGAPLTMAPPALTEAEAEAALEHVGALAPLQHVTAPPPMNEDSLYGVAKSISPDDTAPAPGAAPSVGAAPSLAAQASAPPRGRASETPRRGPVVLVGLGVAAALGVAAVAWVATGGSGAESTTTTTTSAASAPAAPAAPAPASTAPLAPEPPSLPEPVVPEEAPEIDLLAGALPTPLDALWPRVSSGEELPQRERTLISRYASSNRGDARPHLVLARDYMARGWSSDAIREYLEAYDADPACNADSRMRDDLLELATRDGSGPNAARAIARIYGRDALPDVRAMLDGDLEPNPERLLTHLLHRLESL